MMSQNPNWNLFRSFLAVLQEGSLSGAARTLGLTQPTVSRHVDMLEGAIGAVLFLRTQHGMVATDRALGLRPYAETLQSTAAAMMRQASGGASEVGGVVRVSASEIFGVEHLPPILTRLRRRHPALVIELVVSNDIDDLLRRQADIAVRNVEPAQDALVSRRLSPITLGLHASADYLADRGTPQTLAELASHDLVGFDRETPALRGLISRYPSFGREAYALRADSDLAQLAAIRFGFGIGICQTQIAGRDPNLIRVLDEAINIELGVWIVMHHDLRANSRFRAVFNAIVEDLEAAKL